MPSPSLHPENKKNRGFQVGYEAWFDGGGGWDPSLSTPSRTLPFFPNRIRIPIMSTVGDTGKIPLEEEHGKRRNGGP